MLAPDCGRTGKIKVTTRCSGSPFCSKAFTLFKSILSVLPVAESVWNETRFVLIRIADEGIGFDPAYGEKVFEIFRRLHPGHQYGGAGIGLAICKRILDNHQGAITVQSTEGKGTVFSFLLPESQPGFNTFSERFMVAVIRRLVER